MRAIETENRRIKEKPNFYFLKCVGGKLFLNEGRHFQVINEYISLIYIIFFCGISKMFPLSLFQK